MRRRGRGGGLVRGLLLLSIVVASLLPFVSFGQRRLGRPSKALRTNPGIPPALDRVLRASDTLRFTGRRTVTVLKDGRPNRHEEIVVRDGPQLRVEFPSDDAYAGQVIVENGTERRHFNPGTNEVRVLPARGDEGLQRLRALARAGRVSVAPGERVAGYATVDLLVRDAAGNPVQRLSVEPNSGMVLRRIVYDPTGVQAGEFVYTKIDLAPGNLDPALFRIERRGVKTTTPWDTLRRLAKKGGYVAVGLPESTGFRLDGVRMARPAGTPVLLQTYAGPGGGRLSLYELRGAVDPSSLRRKRLHALSWTEGGLTFVLLGPQSDATLTRLRASLTR